MGARVATKPTLKETFAQSFLLKKLVKIDFLSCLAFGGGNDNFYFVHLATLIFSSSSGGENEPAPARHAHTQDRFIATHFFCGSDDRRQGAWAEGVR